MQLGVKVKQKKIGVIFPWRIQCNKHVSIIESLDKQINYWMWLVVALGGWKERSCFLCFAVFVYASEAKMPVGCWMSWEPETRRMERLQSDELERANRQRNEEFLVFSTPKIKEPHQLAGCPSASSSSDVSSLPRLLLLPSFLPFPTHRCHTPFSPYINPNPLTPNPSSTINSDNLSLLSFLELLLCITNSFPNP